MKLILDTALVFTRELLPLHRRLHRRHPPPRPPRRHRRRHHRPPNRHPRHAPRRLSWGWGARRVVVRSTMTWRNVRRCEHSCAGTIRV